ncbi:hypothetical protein JW948_03490 [bacterium]|nr:hypothetical protein [bacterium]
MTPIHENIQSVVKDIYSSKEFRDSQVYSNLLHYLVEAAEKDCIPKEITIAIDVFGKAASFNSNKDSTVRYHIHMLRKKLESYYKNEGKKDSLRLIIPKGHYALKIVSINHQNNFRPRFISIAIRYGSWAVAGILLIILGIVIYRYDRAIETLNMTRGTAVKYSSDPIWHSFLDNGYPITIILGDDYLLDEFNPGLNRYRQIRDWQIDSENDLNNLLIHHPEANLWTSEISGIPFGATHNLMDILPVFYDINREITLKLSSRLALEEIRKNNTLYIGELCNLRVLNKLIYKTPIRYQYNPDERLFIVGEHGDTLHTFQRIEASYAESNKYNVDYSMLLKIPGFEDEVFMFILGFGYGGRLERTKMLSTQEAREAFIREIEQNYSPLPEFFLTVFEVKSIERTGFSNEVKYFQAISEDLFK